MASTGQQYRNEPLQYNETNYHVRQNALHLQSWLDLELEHIVPNAANDKSYTGSERPFVQSVDRWLVLSTL